MTTIDYTSIRAFYNGLGDEESRYIFRSRMNYLVTGDREILHDMTRDVNKMFHPPIVIRSFKDLLTVQKSSDDVVIFSIGGNTGLCYYALSEKGVRVVAFCDPEYMRFQENGYLGLPVISPETLAKNSLYSHCIVVLSNPVWQKTNCDWLISKGFSPEHLYVFEGEYRFTNYVYKPSYFEQEFLSLSENEVYVDVGCLDGYTVRQFSETCSSRYKKIYGFEPHPESYQTTTANIAQWNVLNAEIIQKGAWSSAGELRFVSEYGSGTAGARIAEFGEITISTTTLDEFFGDEQVTFIKMDIEGAELEALNGARKLIGKHKPKLAICVYHKPEDILEIPQLIYQLRPDYRFYIRHHNCVCADGNPSHDTVLYAV